MADKQHGVQHFDAASGTIAFVWPCCGNEATHSIKDMRFEAMHPTRRSQWSLCIGECPNCSPKMYDAKSCPLKCGDEESHSHKVEHFVNCNLPDDHPHPSVPHIKRLLAVLGPPRMIAP